MFTRNAFATLVALFACTPAPSHAVQEVTELDPVYVTAPMPNEYGCQYCWVLAGYGDGGANGGSGGGLPARPGYEVHNGVYVKEDGSVVDASHMYSCSTPYDVLQGVVQLALEENSMIPRYGEVELVLSNGSWTWLRNNIWGADQFDAVVDSNCE